MMKTKSLVLAIATLSIGSTAFASELVLDQDLFAAPAVKATAATPVAQPWMHGDVSAAWKAGFKGQGTTITVVDDMTSGSRISGKLGSTVQSLRHGEWTSLEASMIAPSATVKTIDYASGAKYTPAAKGLNVVNASYGLMAPAGYQVSQINLGTLHTSVVAASKAGTAIIAKAAGNNAVAVNGVSGGKVDYMNLALRGLPGTIYVGALEKHGSPTSKAKLASYSNFAGTDATIQNQFLVVGVSGSTTGLYGTSFAAPQLAAYASVLGSKFTTATATKISQQLLNTARTDTILNYSKAVHGRGEASLSRALAPATIK